MHKVFGSWLLARSLSHLQHCPTHGHTTYTQSTYPGASLTEIAGGPNLQGTSVGAY